MFENLLLAREGATALVTVNRPQVLNALNTSTLDELRPIYDASLTEDRNGTRRALAITTGTTVDKPDSLKKWFGLAFGDALMAAARDEIHVMRGMMRTFHLLERPGGFLQDKQIKRTVFRYMLKGRRRNAAKRLQVGPGRAEILDLVTVRPAA